MNTKIKIVISDRLTDKVVDMFRRIGDITYHPEDKSIERLREDLANASVLVVRSATKVNRELIKSAPGLKIVARAGVGLDNIDLDYCKERKIKVINSPGASTNAVAEHVLGLMLSLYRHIPRANAGMKNKKWDKKLLMGNELFGKTLGIIGFGRIGTEIAKKAKCLGMNVLAYDIRKTESEFAKFVNLDTLLKNSDIVTLHMALVPETQNFMDNETIPKMKNDAVLINAARGGLVNENALYNALKSGHLSGAGIDVYPNEPYSGKLTELPNVVLTPHVAGSTYEAQTKIGKILIGRIEEIFKSNNNE